MAPPPPYTSVVHVRALTGITSSEVPDGRIADAIEYAWRTIRARCGRHLDGLIDKEFLGVSDGVKYRYKTHFYPILDKVEEASGAVTNDTTKVSIFTVDTAEPETYTTVATTEYLLHGEEGMVIFKSTDIPSSGLELYISYKYAPDAIRELETLLAAYHIYFALPNGTDQAKRYYELYEQAYSHYLTEWSATIV